MNTGSFSAESGGRLDRDTGRGVAVGGSGVKMARLAVLGAGTRLDVEKLPFLPVHQNDSFPPDPNNLLYCSIYKSP
jgi:hypothetical protein